MNHFLSGMLRIYVTEPSKILGSPTAVLVPTTLDSHADAPNSSTGPSSCIFLISQVRTSHITDITPHWSKGGKDYVRYMSLLACNGSGPVVWWSINTLPTLLGLGFSSLLHGAKTSQPPAASLSIPATSCFSPSLLPSDGSLLPLPYPRWPASRRPLPRPPARPRAPPRCARATSCCLRRLDAPRGSRRPCPCSDWCPRHPYARDTAPRSRHLLLSAPPRRAATVSTPLPLLHWRPRRPLRRRLWPCLRPTLLWLCAAVYDRALPPTAPPPCPISLARALPRRPDMA
jgi:hypothetical protein